MWTSLIDFYGYYYDANAGGFTLNPIIVRLPFLILPIVLYRWYAKEERGGPPPLYPLGLLISGS